MLCQRFLTPIISNLRAKLCKFHWFLEFLPVFTNRIPFFVIPFFHFLGILPCWINSQVEQKQTQTAVWWTFYRWGVGFGPTLERDVRANGWSCSETCSVWQWLQESDPEDDVGAWNQRIHAGFWGIVNCCSKATRLEEGHGKHEGRVAADWQSYCSHPRIHKMKINSRKASRCKVVSCVLNRADLCLIGVPAVQDALEEISINQVLSSNMF